MLIVRDECGYLSQVSRAFIVLTRNLERGQKPQPQCTSPLPFVGQEATPAIGSYGKRDKDDVKVKGERRRSKFKSNIEKVVACLKFPSLCKH